MITNSLFEKWKALAPTFQSILRIVAGFMFMEPGMEKLFAYPKGMPPNGGTAHLFTEIGLAGVLEVFGGGLLLLGLFTRPVAFLLSGEMAVAYFQAHASRGWWPIMNMGTDAIFYCFLWLFFSAAGPGPWSLDALRRK